MLDVETAHSASVRVFVRSFKLKGSEGSTPFGRPSNIRNDRDVQRIVEKLKDAFKEDQEDQPYAVSWSISPIRSQEGDYSEEDNSSPVVPMTQINFATQMATQMHSRQGEPRTANEVSKAAPEDVLAILRNPLMVKLTKSAANKSDSREPVHTVPSAVPKSILEPVSDHQVKGMTNIAKVNKQQSQFLTKLDSSANVSITEDASNATKPRGAEPEMPLSDDNEKENSQESLNRARSGAPGRTSASTISPPGIPSDDNEKQSSQESLIETKRTLPKQASTSATSAIMNYKPSVPFVDLFQEPNPFERLKRVPRKFVRIPDSQLKLLERRDSWYEPDSGGRSVYATLPPKVRQEMDTFLNRHFVSPAEDQSDHEDDSVEDVGDESGDEQENLIAPGPRRDCHRDEIVTGLTIVSPVKDDSAMSPQPHQPPDRTLNAGQVAPEFSSSGPYMEARSENHDADGHLSDDRSVSWSPSPMRDLDEIEGPNVAMKGYPLLKDDNSAEPQRPSGLSGRTVEEGWVEGSADGEPSTADRTSEAPPSVSYKRLIGPPEKVSAIRPRLRMPVIPSSSPAEEEELELAVLHAVGDIIEEFEDPIDVPETSQELPCTAPTNRRIVQVEQTPCADLRVPDPDLLHSKEVEGKAVKSDRPPADVFSDLVIPATFDSSKSESHVLSSRDDVPVDDSHSDRIGSVGPTPSPTKLQPSLEMAELLDTNAVNHGPSTPPGEELIDSGSTYEGVSPIVQIPATTRKSEQLPPACDSSLLGACNFKRTAHSLGAGPEAISSKRQRRLRLSEKIIQEEYPRVDRNELIRKTRSDFIARLNAEASKPVGDIASEQPVVLDLRDVNTTTNHATDAEARISSTYIESSPGNNVSLSPPLFHSTPENSTQGRDPAQPFASQAPSDLRNCSGDSRAITHATATVQSTNLSNFSQLVFYDEFKATYPDYEGSRSAFTRALVYLEWLRKECGSTMRYYDDFIRVMDSDHKKHVAECLHSEERILTGFEFYNRHILEPVYRYKVITPENLEVALLTLDPKVVQDTRTKFWDSQQGENKPTSKSSEAVTSIVSHENDIVLDARDTVTSEKSPATVDSPNGEDSTLEGPSPQRKRITVSRKPFFETASQQVRTPQLTAVVETPTRGSRATNGSDGQAGSRRVLYWSKERESKFASSAPPKATGALARSSPVGPGERIDSRKISREKEEVAPARQSPASPILGSLRDPSPNARGSKRKRISEAPPSRELEDPFSTAPVLAKAARRATLPAEGADKVSEWIEKTPLKKPSAFAVKVARRSLSGKLPKSATIKRVTGKTYCTAKKVEKLVGPET